MNRYDCLFRLPNFCSTYNPGRIMKIRLIYLLFSFVLSHVVLAQETFYVATPADGGSDTNTGTLTSPFATIERARDEVRKHTSSMSADITVFVKGGKYYLNAPIELDERDSGKNGHQVIYKGYNGQLPEIYGGQPVTGWKQYNGNIYRAFIGIGTNFYNLCENEDGAIEARSPYFAVKFDNRNADTMSRSKELYYDEADIPDSYDLSQAAIHCWVGAADDNWDPRLADVLSVDRGSHRMVTRFDLSIADRYTVFMTGARYYVRGVYEFLDEPGEFFMNKNDGYLYYWPRSVPIEDQHIVRPTTDIIFKVMGSTLNNVVKNITIEGMRLQLTESTHYNNRSDFMEKADGQVRDSRGISPGRQGIVYIENAENIKVRYCKIFSPGIHGVALSFKASHCEVYGNWIKDVGNQAISACGYTPDLHPFHYDPQYGPTTKVADAPANLKFTSIQQGNVNGYHNLSNNRIQNLGFMTGNSTGIKMYISSFNTVTNNDISNGPRHGISHSGPMHAALEGFDSLAMEKDGIVWGENPSGKEGLYRSRGNVVMFNHLYLLVKDSQDVGPIHYYGTGWEPTELANFDHSGYMDSLGNATGASVGKYRNNVCAHNVAHDIYGEYWAKIILGCIQNDDDSNYCIEVYNMVYNWGIANSATKFAAYGANTDANTLTRKNGNENMNIPVDNNLSRTCAVNAARISTATAANIAKTKGINWDNVGLTSDHPWPVTDLFWVRLSADKTFGSLPLTVTLDASQNTTSDPNPTFSWDFDGDGTIDLTGTNAVVTHTYSVKGAYNATVTLTDNVGESTKASTKITAGSTLSRSPVLRYTFDESSGSTISDSSGNHYTGTATGTTTWLPTGGKMNGALDCNGSVSISVPKAAFDSVLDSFTITFWTKSSNRSYANNCLFHGKNSGGHELFELLMDTSAGNFLDYAAGYNASSVPPTDRVIFNASNDFATTADALINDGGKWIHWAFLKNASTGRMNIYKDGNYIHDNTRDKTNQGPRSNIIQDVKDFVIASQVGGANKFNGIIDDFRIYDVLLSPTEILSTMLPDSAPSAPTDIQNDAGSIVNASAANGTTITTFSAVDPNSTDTHTWELLDDAAGRFSLDANSGVLTIADAAHIHVGASTTHDITIRVTDNTGRSFTKTFTLQVSDGGSAPYSSPLDVSGCILWLDANDVDGDGNAEGAGESGLSNGKLTLWKDKSPSGNNASQSTASKQPQLITNAQAGNAVVRMDGVDDFVTFNTISTANSIFWTLKDDAIGDTLNRPLIGTFGANVYQTVRGEHSIWHSQFATGWLKNGSTYLNGNVTDGMTTDLGTGYNVVSLLADSSQTPTTVNALATDRGLTDRFWKGDMNEVIIYDRTLTDAERQGLEAYLDAKWINPVVGNFPPDSLSLSSSSVPDPASNGDVIGVVSATDPNAGDSLSFTLVDNAGGRFVLNGTSLKVANASAITAGTKYDVTIRVSDGSLIMERIFELEVGGTAPANTAPIADIQATPTSGTAPLTVSFDGSGSSDSDGSIATYAWDFDNDGTTDASGSTASHTYSSDGIYTAKLTVTDNGGKSASTTTTITVSQGTTPSGPTPIAWYKLDETSGTQATNSVGSSYHGTANRTSILVGAAGKYGTAASFRGGSNDDFIDTDVNVGSANNLTVAFWAKASQMADQVPLDKMHNNDITSLVYGWEIRFRANGGIRFNIGDGEDVAVYSNIDRLEASTQYALNTWVHVAASFDGTTGTAKIYIDGVLAGTKTGITKRPGNTSIPLRIGRRNVTSRAGDRFGGELDDVRIFHQVLTASEIMAVKNNTSTSGGSTFASWAAAEGLTGVVTADYDSDGVNDFVEYALGMQAKVKDASSQGSFTVQPSGDVLYRFAKPIPDVSYRVQYTSDLSLPWQDYTGSETDSGTELSVTIPNSAAIGGNLYIRLKLTQ